ncbi:MAG: bifunctional YncE family protein/alkaline phosphatase family protein [Janthinobacterium lividum]
MIAFKSQIAFFSLTLGLTTALAGFGLAHSAAKPVTLPDRPDSKGTGTRLPNGWHITPAGKPIALPGDLPLKMIWSRDGKYLLVNTGGFHDQEVSVIDRATQKVTQSINLGKDWAGMCLDPDGDDLYVSGGGAPDDDFLKGAAKAGATPAMVEAFQHPIQHLGFEDGTLSPKQPIDITGVSTASTPAKSDWFMAGLVSGPDKALYAVDIQNDTVYKLSGQPRTVTASVKVGYRPYALALSPNGQALAVSNWGDKSVSFLRTSNLTELERVQVGSLPNEMTWSKDGRLFVANAGSNSVSVIAFPPTPPLITNLSTLNPRVVETIKTSLDPKDLVGSTPDALVVSPDSKRLYVANADNNDVAVIDISNAKEARVLGFIPTGWYPSALAVAPDGRSLYIGTGKGLGFRGNPNATLADPQSVHTQSVGGHKYDYIAGILSGAVSVVRLPDAQGLKAYTQQVMANTPPAFSPLIGPTRDATVAQMAKMNSLSALHKIKHVVYIIRENRTYDQVFGDIKEGNGDPDLTIFGQTVTPNAHALASHYVLLDNLYVNGEVSEDGHKWCDAAYATDFIEKSWPSSYSGRGEPDGDDRVADSPAGEIWDNCARHGITYRSYGEAADFHSTPNAPPVFTGDKGLRGHVNTDWAKFPFGVGRDTQRAALFLGELKTAEKTGVWPQFMVAWLPEDHTAGLKPGAFTPIAAVASNDQAVGQIVEGISHSHFWKNTAIFVIEDDAQNGPDHVDAHRTVGLVISPYVKRGAVDSTQYSTASMVRTMELILGLPPMTQYDQKATPMLNSFMSTPDLTAYANIGPKVDLEAKNPQHGEGETASSKLDFSGPDRADPDALNAILWHALKPGVPEPAPVRSAHLLR